MNFKTWFKSKIEANETGQGKILIIILCKIFLGLKACCMGAYVCIGGEGGDEVPLTLSPGATALTLETFNNL